MRWRQSDFTFLKNWHFYLYDGALLAGPNSDWLKAHAQVTITSY